MPKKGKGKKKGKKGKKGEGKLKKQVDPNVWREQFQKAEEDYKQQERKKVLKTAGESEEHQIEDTSKDVYHDSDDGLDDSIEFTEEHHHENHVTGLTHMKTSELLGRSINQYSAQFNLGPFGKKLRRFDKSLITQGKTVGEQVIPEQWEQSSFVLAPDRDLSMVEGEDNVTVSKWNINGHPSARIKPKPKTPTPPPTPPTPPRDLAAEPDEKEMIQECKSLVARGRRKKRTKGLLGKLRKHVRQDSKLNERMLQNILDGKLYTDEEEELAYTMGLLPKFEIFKDLSVKRLFWIAQEATAMRFHPGQMITEEGEHGKYVYFIIKGTVHVRMRVTTMEKRMDAKNKKNSSYGVVEEREDPNKWEKYSGDDTYTVGKYVEVKTIGRGQMFGEDVMFRDTYLLSVCAVSDCHIMAIDRMKILDNLDLSTKIQLSQRSEVNMRIRDQHEGVLRREFARARIVPTDFKLYVEEGGDPVNHLSKPSVMYRQAQIGVVKDNPQGPINKSIDHKDMFNNTITKKQAPVANNNNNNNTTNTTNTNGKSGHRIKPQREWKHNKSPQHPTLSQDIVAINGAKAAMMDNRRMVGAVRVDPISHRSHGSNESGTEGNVTEVMRLANRLDRKAHAHKHDMGIYHRLGVAKQSNMSKTRQSNMRRSVSQPALTKINYVPGGKAKRGPVRRPLFKSKNPFDRYAALVAASKKKKHLTVESDSDWLARMVANDHKKGILSSSPSPSPSNEGSERRGEATPPLGKDTFHPFPAREPEKFHFSKASPGDTEDALDKFTHNHLGFHEVAFIKTHVHHAAGEATTEVGKRKPAPEYRSSPGGVATQQAIKQDNYDQIIVTYPKDWFKANATTINAHAHSTNARAQKLMNTAYHDNHRAMRARALAGVE